ncbi:MAG: DegV family protein [Clostridia bacterium]|nr:DegV family protein [Clostridia bacterium]
MKEAKFVVSTDSTADLYADEMKKLGVWVGPLTFTLEKNNVLTEHLDNFQNEQEYIDFYNKLREGYVAKTSILSVQAHIDLFTSMAKAGVKHALHLTQSYGLSPTLDNANKALAIVKEEYPDLDYVTMQCNTTTVGEGECVRYACKLRDEGKTNVQAKELIDKMKDGIQHFIIVDDLMYLKRGGRISGASAAIGSLMQIKPIIEFTRHGTLETARKEMGMKKALRSVIAEYNNYTRFKPWDRCIIVHTDNLPVANQMKEMVKETLGVEADVRMIGPIIGAHLGPGAVAFAFTSNEKRPLE